MIGSMRSQTLVAACLMVVAAIALWVFSGRRLGDSSRRDSSPQVPASGAHEEGAVDRARLQPGPERRIQVELAAEGLALHLRYPGIDKAFGTSDDFTTENDLHVPVGVPVALVMGTMDVGHTLWIPAFRWKGNLVPGRRTRVQFEVNCAGSFPIFCPKGTSKGPCPTKGKVVAESKSEFEAWSTRQAASQRGRLSEEENRIWTRFGRAQAPADHGASEPGKPR